MKRTNFRLIEDFDNVKALLDKYLPSWAEDEIEIVEEDGGYTVYVIYDDTDVKIRELEDCVKTVLMLESYLDAWNMIQQYSEDI